MASFPTSVKSFASRSNGGTIDAGHVNDLQDEVNAVEDGYLNGTARLNSSGSTVTSLSVTGGSTLGGTLQVTGRSTFAFRPTMPPPDAVRLEIGAALEVPVMSTTGIPWKEQAFITNSSLHSTGTSTQHQNVYFQSTGIYYCIAQAGWRTATSTMVQIEIKDSSGASFARSQQRQVNGNIRHMAAGFKRIDTIGASPYARAVAYCEGTTNSLSAVASETWFSVVKM